MGDNAERDEKMKKIICFLIVLVLVLTACSKPAEGGALSSENKSSVEDYSQISEESENDHEEIYKPVITTAAIEPVDGYIEVKMGSILFDEIMTYENFVGRDTLVSFDAFEDWNYTGYYIDGRLYFIEWSCNDSDAATSYLYVYDNKDGNYQQIYNGSYRNCSDEAIELIEDGIFSEGYCFSSYTLDRLAEDDPESQTRYERHYLLTFGEYVANAQVAIRLYENHTPYEIDETQCQNFISSLNIF